MKNKHLASIFPTIYRFITENKLRLTFNKYNSEFKKKLKKTKLVSILTSLLVVYLIFISTLIMLFFAVSLYKNINSYVQIKQQRQQIQSQINFWKSISSKYEGYKDAYFKLALLEYKLGNLQKANEFNYKSLVLDPNFEDAKELEKLINK